MCRHCKEQYEDQNLAYTLILEVRENAPNADMYLSKFCSKAHVQEFLQRIHFQEQRYVLSKVTNDGTKRFDPAAPLNLLLLVGSSKAS
jgi:hypothetical protein